MIINIDTDFVDRVKLTIFEYVLLYLLYNDCKDSIEVSNDTILSLEKKGFIKDQTDGIILRKKALDLFKNNSIPTKQKELEDFVTKYRDLFPIGVKTGGRICRGDKQGCIKKFKSFNLKYPEYTQDDILDATKAYIDLLRKKNYDRITSADYFIEKDGLSQLASYCEDIKIRGKQTVKDNGSVGKTKGI